MSLTGSPWSSQPLDHPVYLGDLLFGVSEIVTVSARRDLQLLVLREPEQNPGLHFKSGGVQKEASSEGRKCPDQCAKAEASGCGIVFSTIPWRAGPVGHPVLA